MSGIFNHLNTLLAEVGAEKQAKANTEPEGYAGGTSHPSKDVEDGTRDVTTGARFSENETDNKDSRTGTGNMSTDATPDRKPGENTQDKRQIGGAGKATGEDPANEDDYKGDKYDPGTSHPARVDDGEKYASASFSEGRAKSEQLGNEILAEIFTGNVKSAGYQGQATAGDAEKQAAQAAGYELAEQLGMQKMSAAQVLETTAATMIKDACVDADLCGSYLSGYLSERQKQAMEGEELPPEEAGEAGDPTGGAAEGEDHDAPGDESSGKGGDAGEPTEDPLAALGGGDPLAALGGGGGDPMMGGDPMGGDPMGGGDPMMGPPSEDQMAGALEGLGGEPAAPPSEDEALAELVAALQETGIGEEEMAQAGPAGEKIASAVRKFKRSGKYSIKEATTPRQQAIRNHMKSHVLEMVGN